MINERDDSDVPVCKVVVSGHVTFDEVRPFGASDIQFVLVGELDLDSVPISFEVKVSKLSMFRKAIRIFWKSYNKT